MGKLDIWLMDEAFRDVGIVTVLRNCHCFENDSLVSVSDTDRGKTSGRLEYFQHQLPNWLALLSERKACSKIGYNFSSSMFSTKMPYWCRGDGHRLIFQRRVTKEWGIDPCCSPQLCIMPENC